MSILFIAMEYFLCYYYIKEVVQININERVKVLRKELGLSQKEFGEKIAVAQGYLTNIETGKRDVTTKMAKLICLQFKVNEEWLRHGKGEMFQEISQENELAAYCAQICAGRDDHMANIILAYMRLEDSSKAVINKFIDGLLESAKETKKDTSN